ncbi:hypothetical protein HZS_2761, partial [Henneguya salminicola]
MYTLNLKIFLYFYSLAKRPLLEKTKIFGTKIQNHVRKFFSKRRSALEEMIQVPFLTIDDAIIKGHNQPQSTEVNESDHLIELQYIGALLEENNLPPEYSFPSSFVKCVDHYGEHIIEILPPPNQKFSQFLLPPSTTDKPCIVVDLDETLIHSAFVNPDNTEPCDLEFTLNIEGEPKKVFLYCRPYYREFIEFIGAHYECILFTASIEKYASVVLDYIDPSGNFKHRLFRNSCSYSCLGLVKDLSKLGRDVNKTIIVDNSPICYLLQ